MGGNGEGRETGPSLLGAAMLDTALLDGALLDGAPLGAALLDGALLGAALLDGALLGAALLNAALLDAALLRDGPLWATLGAGSPAQPDSVPVASTTAITSDETLLRICGSSGPLGQAGYRQPNSDVPMTGIAGHQVASATIFRSDAGPRLVVCRCVDGSPQRPRIHL